MIEYIAMMLSITGNIFICFRKRQGFLFWIVGNCLWVSFAFLNNHWGMMFLFFFYTGMSTFGFYNWKKYDKEEKC